MADNFKTINDLDISFKEFMPGQIIQSAQFNDDMRDIEEKVNEVIGEHNKVSTSVMEHICSENNPHRVTAHQVGTYTVDEIDGLIEEVKDGHFYDNAITNRVLGDGCVDNRTLKDKTITAVKVEDGFGNQIDISENIEITDRYTKSEVDELVRSKVGEGAYTKEEIDQKFEEVQSGQIIDKTISADKVTSDFGDNIDISNNTSITNRYTKGEVDNLIAHNGLPKDWGYITDEPTNEVSTFGSLPVAGHMVAGQFVSPATSVLDIDVKENVEARGEYSSVGERLDGVDSQIKESAKDVLLEDGKLYLKKSDGTKLGTGVVLPVGGSGGSITWESVTGKPATFTPSSHNHSKSEIRDFPTIPTKVSQLQNDSDFATETFVTTKIEEAQLNDGSGASSVKSIKDFGAKCDGVTDDTMSFESALSSDSSVIKIPRGIMLIRQGQSYISHGVKKKVIGEEGSIIKCDFDSCKHFLNLSINVEFENVTFDFNNKNILNAITFSENVGLIRMKNVTFQNVNDTDSAKSTVIVNITDGEVDIDNIKFKNMKKRGNGSVTDGGGNLTCLGYFPSTERKGVIKNITIQNTHNVNSNNAIIFEDVSGVYVGGDATNRDILLVENINGYNFGKRLIKTQCSNIIIRDTYGFSNVGDSLSCVGVGDTSSQGDSEIAQSNIIVENFRAEGKIIAPISTSCKNVIFRNGFINTDACDMPGNTGGSRAFLVTGSNVTFDNIVASTNVIGFIDNHPHESLKNASGKNISFNNCSFTIKDANQVYGITTSYGKEAKLDNIKLHNVDIIYGSAKMGIIDFSRGVFNNIDIDNLNVEYPNVDANFSADGIILDKCNNVTISDVNFKSNSVKGLFEGIKVNQCTNLTIDNVATDQNDPEQKCRLLNIQNSTGVSVSNIKKGNYRYLAFNTCQDVFLSDVDSSKISNINSSINMVSSFSL